MKEELTKILTDALSRNVGQKLTEELASGILIVVTERYRIEEASKKASEEQTKE